MFLVFITRLPVQCDQVFEQTQQSGFANEGLEFQILARDLQRDWAISHSKADVHAQQHCLILPELNRQHISAGFQPVGCSRF